MKRENLLLSLIPDRDTAILLTSFPVLSYYAGYPAPEGGAILAGSFGVVLYPSFSAERKAGFRSLRRGLPPEIKRLEIETSSVSAMDAILLKQSLSIDVVLSGELEQRIASQRQRKQPDEIEKLRRAQQITDRAFANALNFIHPGMTDWELQKLIADKLWEEGSQMTSFNHVVGCGADTADPHVRPTGRTAQRGDLIMMDIGASVEGYGSDMTRMISLGPPNNEQREIYELVKAAQAAGLAAVKAGVKCSEIDRAARQVIEQAGYGDAFPHGLGHPVGAGGQEGPRLCREEAQVLPFDIVVTVEPGIYLPGKFGIRIEDMVLVCKDKIENLTQTSHELFVMPLFYSPIACLRYASSISVPVRNKIPQS